MSRPWASAIGQLRRRAGISGAVEAFGRLVIYAAPLSLVLFGFSRVSPWARFLAPYFGVAALAVFLVGIVIGFIRSLKSDVYFAKWIDLTSRLDDRLASAVEWSQLSAIDAFQQRCIEQLTLELGAQRWRLVQPRLRSERLPITFASTLLITVVVIGFVHRPVTTVVEKDAAQKATLEKTVAADASREVQLIASQARTQQDAEMEALTTSLSTLLENINKGVTSRESAFKQIEQIRKQIDALQTSRSLRDLHGGDQRGPVATLARAMMHGSTNGVRDAIRALTDALNNDALSPEEMTELQPLLTALSQLAKDSDATLVNNLDAAAQAIRNDDSKEAAKRLESSQSKLGLLDGKLAAAQMVRRATETLRALQQSLQNPQGAPAAFGANPAGDPETLGSSSSGMGVGSTGAGAQGAEERVQSPTVPDRGRQELRVPGVWNGKIMQQLFDTSNAQRTGEAIQKLLIEHERVVEDRFRHDDVPREYEEAVHAYFAALHQKGNEWNQPKK